MALAWPLLRQFMSSAAAAATAGAEAGSASSVASKLGGSLTAVRVGSLETNATGSRPTKMKNHFKRASSVMADVTRESWLRMQDKMDATRPQFPQFNVGDAIEIQYANEMNEASPLPIRGTVIAKRNKGVDSKFSIINSMDDQWYTATYTYSSPLLRSIRVMMRNRHSDGERRARRAKLTYLFDKDTNVYHVDQHTKGATERTAEKLEKREERRTSSGKRKGKPDAKAAAATAKAKAGAGGAAAAAGAKKAAPAPAAAKKK